jgi:hypothetical protein
MPTDSVDIDKIENGYTVEYDTIDPESGEEVEVCTYFPTKVEALAYAASILA